MRRNQSTKVPAAASQRITRLKSREISAKPTPERKLTPKRKAVIINKNLKVNVSAKNKTKESISVRNSQIPVRCLRPREISATKPIPERKLKPERKAVIINKNVKVNVSAKNKTLHLSKENISLRNSQIPVRCLRPRLIRKNYCDDSRLLQQFISPKQQDGIVIIEKPKENVEDKKVPVCKVEPFEKSSEDKNVYDFKFDSNDIKEKASDETEEKKLKKKNVNKQKGKTTKRTRNKKVIAKTHSHKIIESPKIDADPSAKIIQNDSPLEFVVTTTSVIKIPNPFNFVSPWQSPFSETKHFIQSTPYKDFETKKGNKEIKKESMETSKEIIKPNKENMESSKENMKSNKENMVPNKENMESNKEKRQLRAAVRIKYF